MAGKKREEMGRRSFLRQAGLGAAACVLPGVANGDESNSRPPNFVVVFTDDQGYGDLGCYGREDIRTPHVDRMAAEGMKFTDFYVAAPICSPSRVALLTGSYPRRVGLADWVLRPDSRRGIHPDETTIAEMLKGRDYATMAIGKWHVGFLPPFQPQNRGFDEYFGIYHNMDKWEMKHFENGMPLKHNGRTVERLQSPATLTERYTKEAVRFVKENRDRPFFLYLAHTMPHVPLAVTDRWKGRSEAGLYGDVIECLDWSTGRIVETLRELNLEQDTYVIFTSDNGPATRVGSSAGPLRGRKLTTYEGGLRVPCVMWAPGRIPAGTVCREVATTMDFMPTFAALAGADLPGERRIDGGDIGNLMSAQSGAHSPYDAFFYHGAHGKLAGVRVGKWKLHTAKRTELFDLENDVGETTNVDEEHPDVVKRLKRRMKEFDRRMQEEARPAGKA